MKTLKELFEQAGISEESQQKFSELLKGGHTNGGDLEVVIANNGEYVKAEKFDALKTQNSDLTSKLNEANEKLNNYNALSEKYNTLESEYNGYKVKASENEDTLRKQFEVEKLIIKNNLPPINGSYNAYMSGVDFTNVKKNDKGEFEGIDTAFNQFKEKNKMLFEKMNTQVIPPDTGVAKIPDKQPGIDVKAFGKMSYKDRLNLKENEPELYAELVKKESEKGEN